AHDTDEPHLSTSGDVGARAQFTRPLAADIDDTNTITVLLTEQRHRAEVFRLGQRHHPGDDLEVVTNGDVGALLDLAARLGRQRLVPAEVEAHVAGLVVRARLVRL